MLVVAENDAEGTSVGRQRRSRIAGGARSKTIGVRVTPEERAEVERLAGERGMTPPELLLSAALTESIEGADQVAERRLVAAELMAVQRIIGRTADNMNQIAKKANTVHEVPSDFTAAVAEARTVWFRCEQVLEEFVELNRRAGA
ncbi:hypothetical protein GCM10009710_36720 [Aeromicrobium alkaliterrae]|uniref:Plasmid mobilization relaxosome protein MobC n=1 Tax=Aeromicrobium alkaliterrae TaxID=302168 RepID=A0ABP4WFX3_9ACTN